MLRNREILLGVCGSIAAYKAAEFARLLLKEGAKVQVVMTRGASEFVAPLTFFSLTGREAYSEMFSGGAEVATAHISLARKAELIVVAPATAHTIARVARGEPSDLLSTAIVAAHSPVILAPAMNAQMLKHPGVQANLTQIQQWPNYYIAASSSGEMACGEYGFGRLAEPAELVAFCKWVLGGGRQDLVGQKVVVSAGPTFEDVDPVRFLSNRSTGKMGFALAAAAAWRGAQVSLVTSVTQLPIPAGCVHIPVRSAAEMAEAVHTQSEDADILLMAAAVADYRPATAATQKLKKSDGELQIPLARTQDILATLKPSAKRITVGFAAETHEVLAHAEGKMKRKHLDMIVANDVSQPGSGFGTDTNQVTLLRPGREPASLPMLSKESVAERILDAVQELRAHREAGEVS